MLKLKTKNNFLYLEMGFGFLLMYNFLIIFSLNIIYCFISIHIFVFFFLEYYLFSCNLECFILIPLLCNFVKHFQVIVFSFLVSSSWQNFQQYEFQFHFKYLFFFRVLQFLFLMMMYNYLCIYLMILCLMDFLLLNKVYIFY